MLGADITLSGFFTAVLSSSSHEERVVTCEVSISVSPSEVSRAEMEPKMEVVNSVPLLLVFGAGVLDVVTAEEEDVVWMVE